MEELYNKYNKSLDLVHDDGIHEPESADKICVVKPTKQGFWELVYAEYEDYIKLIHIKHRRGKP